MDQAKCLKIFLGFDLNDEVHVVPDRAQIGLHAEIRAFESTAGGKTSQVNLVEGILTDFVYNTLSVTGLVTRCRVSFPVIVSV